MTTICISLLFLSLFQAKDVNSQYLRALLEDAYHEFKENHARNNSSNREICMGVDIKEQIGKCWNNERESTVIEGVEHLLRHKVNLNLNHVSTPAPGEQVEYWQSGFSVSFRLDNLNKDNNAEVSEREKQGFSDVFVVSNRLAKVILYHPIDNRNSKKTKDEQEIVVILSQEIRSIPKITGEVDVNKSSKGVAWQPLIHWIYFPQSHMTSTILRPHCAEIYQHHKGKVCYYLDK